MKAKRLYIRGGWQGLTVSTWIRWFYHPDSITYFLTRSSILDSVTDLATYPLTWLTTWSTTRSTTPCFYYLLPTIGAIYLVNYDLLSLSSCYLPRVYIEPLDLHSQLSCLVNFHTLQSLQLWARIAPPADQSIGSQAVNLLPRSRSHYFSYLCKCLELLHLLNERTIDRRSYLTT